MSTESFLDKLKNINTRTYTLPILQEEITYKKMDVIESSINRSLPNFLASRVLETMKKAVAGQETPVSEIPDLEDDDVRELLVKATEMWKKLVIEPKLTDEQVVEIPAEDRLAWFLNAVAETQQSDVRGGGVVNATEVASFPDEGGSKRNTKRSSNS